MKKRYWTILLLMLCVGFYLFSTKDDSPRYGYRSQQEWIAALGDGYRGKFLLWAGKYCSFDLCRDILSPLLFPMAESSNSSKKNAIREFQALNGKQMAAFFIDTHKSDNASIRAWGMSTVWESKSSADKTVPVLMDYLSSDDDEIRSAAALVLGRIGADAEKAIPALINSLADESIIVRSNAAGALRGIGVSSVPFLEKAMVSEAGQEGEVKRLLEWFRNRQEG